MGLGGLDMWEMLVILVVALLVCGARPTVEVLRKRATARKGELPAPPATPVSCGSAITGWGLRPKELGD